MTLIAGVGDEVTHFFIGLLIIIIVSLAWWTTNISEQRHVRTVLVVDGRYRPRIHRRLTNHTETVTITEGTSTIAAGASDNISSTNESAMEASSSSSKPTEASTSSQAKAEVRNGDDEEQSNIIETMDADACVLRQRRLAFYGNWNVSSNNQGLHENAPQTSRNPSTTPPIALNVESAEASTISTNQGDAVIVETVHCISSSTSNDLQNSIGGEANGQTANLDKLTIEKRDHTSSTTSDEPQTSPDDESCIRIKLKYINDDLKLVNGYLQEQLGEFRRRNFQLELNTNKVVRLIFNGQVLHQDTQTLQSCGFFDNCVVHCLIHQKRPSPGDGGNSENVSDRFLLPGQNRSQHLNTNNQGRDWDFGNFFIALVTFTIVSAWYLRYFYAHLYTVTATVGLILITGLFSVVFIGMYFPDNEQRPAPRIIHAERVQPQQ